MDDIFRYAIGIDVGTENVRAVVATVGKDGKLTVVGYNESKNAGMRKGIVANLAGPAEAIDKTLGEVERMSGYEINSATVSVNGAQILTTNIEGMIAVGDLEHEINFDDLDRIQQVATTGRIPANRDILSVIPLGYSIDGQPGMKDPIGMIGSRLEMKASVITALSPKCVNLRKTCEAAKVIPSSIVPSVVAGATAVLSEKQKENGVAVVDFGGTTTSVAIYEEGDLQYVGVVPAGSNNVTNDLAIVLEVNTDIAEEIKRRYVDAAFNDKKDVVLKVGREEMKFDREVIDDVVKARLEEILIRFARELKKAGFDRRLPEGIVLIGGGARMRGIEVFTKQAFEASVKIGIPEGLSGIADSIKKPEYAVAIGLMMFDSMRDGENISKGKNKIKKEKSSKGDGMFKKFFKKFK